MIIIRKSRPLSCMHLKFYSNHTNSNLFELLKSMPKVPKHIAEAQKQRIKIKEKYSKYVPGRVTLQVLGTGAPGAPKSLYMFSDQSRYLFNCGEGTQRLAHEHKMKLARLEHIFITQPVWRNIGGLPGTALTIQDVGVPQITLHGPQRLEEIFTATKRFVIIKDLHIKTVECNEGAVFEDNVMRVQYVPLMRSEVSFNGQTEALDEELSKEVQVGTNGVQYDASTSTRSEKKHRRRSHSRQRRQALEIVEDNTDYYAHERKGKRNRHRSRSHSVSDGSAAPSIISHNSEELLRETKEKGISMAYICKLQPRPGALLLDKCVQHGVPPGPLLGKLKAGEDITLESGVTVRSSDVCEPNDPGPVFIVIDCPSEEYLNSLLENEMLRRHQASASCDEDVAALVVHFTPKDVFKHHRYKQWMDSFSPSTRHLVLNECNTCMGSVSVHRIQYKLNLLDKEMFPLLGDKGTENAENDEDVPASKKIRCDGEKNENEGTSKEASDDDGLIYANTFCSFHLRPKKGLDRSAELKLAPSQYIQETVSVPGFNETLQTLKENLSLERKNLTVRPFPKIVFLGTGSCIPNKTRNTSGILLQTNADSFVLLDCGEGTYGQLVRFYGQEKSTEVLANVNAVYVSHLHADHHIGLIGFLQGRRRALKSLGIPGNPILLFAPKQILAWLSFYDRCFESIVEEFDLVANGDLLMNEEKLDIGAKLRICDVLDLKDIKTTYVRHCPNAFGVSLVHKDGYKITYSGDTMPSENLVALGTKSDILIHEATMEDELAHEAVVKMHSTTSQAIEIGQLMHAKNILLTHFSQRYAKLPRFNDNFADNVGIAFDNMQVKLDELPLVPLLYPSLRLMFAEHYEELETKAVKRQRRWERDREASMEHQQSAERQKQQP